MSLRLEELAWSWRRPRSPASCSSRPRKFLGPWNRRLGTRTRKRVARTCRGRIDRTRPSPGRGAADGARRDPGARRCRKAAVCRRPRNPRRCRGHDEGCERGFEAAVRGRSRTVVVTGPPPHVTRLRHLPTPDSRGRAADRRPAGGPDRAGATARRVRRQGRAANVTVRSQARGSAAVLDRLLADYCSVVAG